MTVFSPVYSEVKRLFLKFRKTWPHVPVCLGGPYVTTIMEEIFEETPADFAVYGEGEITFSELLFYLKGNRDINHIKGLMYREGNGRVITNPPMEQILDIDSLPLPDYSIFPMHKYPLHRMVTSRGCPFACSFCNSTSIWGNKWRARSPENILNEVKFLIEKYGKKIFVFGDNSFNIDLKRVEKFCDLLIENKIKILWSASIRADIITPQIARKMKEAGCYNVAVGIESANNTMLENIGKKTSIEQLGKGIKIFKKAGIEVLGQFVIGSPFETLQTVKESVEWAKSSECDFVNFYTILPFKGTPQWDFVKQNGTLMTQKIHDFHSINPRIVFVTPEFTYQERLESIKLVKREGFYSNKDKKNWMFDFAKETSRKIQEYLPDSLGDKIYMLLKLVYRMKMVKKNNV